MAHTMDVNVCLDCVKCRGFTVFLGLPRNGGKGAPVGAAVPKQQDSASAQARPEEHEGTPVKSAHSKGRKRKILLSLYPLTAWGEL